MKRPARIRTLFLDIGGVLLSDGWDHLARRRAAAHFGLKWADMETKHHLNFDTFEQGKLNLEDYLGRVVFDQRRGFTRAQFRRFMFAQSTPFPAMIELMGKLKAQYGLRVSVVSNEARELNAHRIEHFGLGRLADSFISSCFVHLRKPDADIFRLALDVSQTPADQVAYVENTPMFARVAQGLGIRTILHTGYPSTRAKLGSLGLTVRATP